MTAQPVDSAQRAETVQMQPAREASGPPDTSYYMNLGYSAAGVIFALYIGLMLRRIAAVRKVP